MFSYIRKHPLVSAAVALVAAQVSPVYPASWKRPLDLLPSSMTSALPTHPAAVAALTSGAA